MNTAKCPNCQAAITCSCQIRTASDGSKVCSKCITSYQIAKANSENKLTVVTASVIIKE